MWATYGIFSKTVTLQHVSNTKKISMRSSTGFLSHYAYEMLLYSTRAACLNSDVKF